MSTDPNPTPALVTRTIDYTTPPQLPAHAGVLAVYTDKFGNRWGVDVIRMSRSWAEIVVLIGPTALHESFGQTRKVQPVRISVVESGDYFWWHWPNQDHYDYSRIDTLKAYNHVPTKEGSK